MLLQASERRKRMEQFGLVCRSLRLPVTFQRRTIYEAVLSCPDHPSVDDVLEIARKRMPELSRVTVYRVLETLAQHGLITRASHRGGVIRYDVNIERHHHLVCTNCDQTIDLDDSALDRVKLPDTSQLGFQIADFSIHFSGVCRACRRSAARPRPGKARTGGRKASRASARKMGRRQSLERSQ